MMLPFPRLRRSLAQVIYPEMRIEARLKAAREARLFDAATSNRGHTQAFLAGRMFASPSWRDVSRICLPGWIIHRAIGWTMRPLYQVGPAICLRLEQRIERLDDNQALGRLAILLRSAALWLTQSPNTAPQAILEQKSGEVFSQPMPDPLPGSAPEFSQSERISW